MSIERIDFDSIKEQDLQELIEGQVPEGLRLEFKLTEYGKDDKDKREFLKDISALANSNGGHLILGIDELEGVAKKIIGIDVDQDAEIRRMEQMARAGLEPCISGLRIKAIRLSIKKHAFFIRVPKSWNPPHRVIAQNSNRFYVRHEGGVHEPNVEELRTLFTQSASALEQARQFREERIQFIINKRGEHPLEGGGRLILHIVPVAAFSGAVQIDINQANVKSGAFQPIGAETSCPRFNYYGFITERLSGQNNYSNGYTQIFRNGILEATKAKIIFEPQPTYLAGADLPIKSKESKKVNGSNLEKQIIHNSLPLYLKGLQDIGVPPPIIILVTLEGVKGVTYSVPQNRDIDDIKQPLPEDLLKLPECILEDYSENILDYQKAVKPAFDALWNAIGFPGDQFFNENGLWNG